MARNKTKTIKQNTMNLINHTLQTDIYQYINTPPLKVSVIHRPNEAFEWYLEFIINEDTQIYYPYYTEQDAINDDEKLHNFLNYIYS